MKNYRRFLFSAFSFAMFVGLFFSPIEHARAQTDFDWSEPINLSNSGASTEPNLVIDAKGVIHVIWVDEFDGYKYVQSADGVEWTLPVSVNFPFSAEDDFSPMLLADESGVIHVMWMNGSNTLYYSSASSSSFGTPSSWRGIAKLADSVVDFDAKVGPNGTLHIGYVNILEGINGPAGVYYRRLSGAGWSPAQSLYASQYFRSLEVGNANVRLSVSNDNIYFVWDDRSRKRIFFARSRDGGEDWGDAAQIQGPEDLAGLELPFNINVNASNGGYLLTWQVGIPGNNCIQYSQWSLDGENLSGAPGRMIDEFAACAQRTDFIAQDEGFLVALLSGRDDLSMIAWNGETWSELQTQGQLSTFINPITLDSVLLSCYKASFYKGRLFVVGCDSGAGGDIWFSSRLLGSFDEWFPPPSAWTAPSILSSVGQNVSALSSVADGNNNIHVFWVQSPFSAADDGVASIFYSRWNGRWSEPRSIISGVARVPTDLSAATDNEGRLLLSWVDGDMGDLYFSWANADRANIATEWSRPELVATGSQLGSSPDMVADDSGKIIIAYSIPLNEGRGIYLIQTEDLGRTWSGPVSVVYALDENWDSTDHPTISLTSDGTLHILFNRYSLREEGESEGLYYSQSTNGGLSWSQPRVVTENYVRWSQIVSLNDRSLHIVWLEKLGLGYTTYHQLSRDGGESWDSPTSVSNLPDSSAGITLAADISSQFHVIETYSRNDSLVVQVLVWDGSRWSTSDEREIDPREGWLEYSTIAEVSSKGTMQVLISFVYPDSIDEAGSDILSISRSIGEFSDGEEIPPLLISTPSALSVTPETVDIQSTSTEPSPISSLVDTSAPSRGNLFGWLLMAVVLIGVFIFVLPRRKKR
jgi:hypothetical protein